MHLERIRVQGLRCFRSISLELDSGINVFEGDNGAGKTSLLEAVFLLSHARSFRSGSKDALIKRGEAGFSVYAELRDGQENLLRVGLGRSGVRWEAKLDGTTVPLGRLIGACAVVCFEPGSHALIAGSAEERRRYLDWGVFHVEHDFLLLWRRYQRALKQRNSLLRSHSSDDALFEPWEAELSHTADAIDGLRRNYVAQLLPLLGAQARGLMGEMGQLEFRYRRGWGEEVNLFQQLRDQRPRDRARGHTTAGAHRADWSIAFPEAPAREHLSRGQEKLTALACMLAQAALYATQHREWPIICLDDLASELDVAHQAAVASHLVAVGAQVLLTGTQLPSALDPHDKAVFHVEQGQVARLL